MPSLVKTTFVTVQTPAPIFSQFWISLRDNIESCLYNDLDKQAKNETLKRYKEEVFEKLFVKKELYQELKSQLAIADETKMEIQPDDGIKKQIITTLRTEFSEIERKVFALRLSKEVIIKQLNLALDEFLTTIIKANLIEQGRRVDGRALDQTRPISSQVGVLPQTHGSSLFQRGETQVLNVLTLGPLADALELDGIEDILTKQKHYIHHYNFPPYSVGETGRYMGPRPREIGHGSLAEKALLPVLPSQDKFPYTMRLVSECLGSNGSTSMASTCASTLSLMDGGVPIKAMVAGVAMGLALEDVAEGIEPKFAVLTDIQGMEDHHADMDFKVTGTREGVTAIQLDNKAGGLSAKILIQALEQAKNGRLYILDKMQEVIDKPRRDISERAPRVVIVMVPLDKIRDVIGSGGSIINGMEQEFGVEISLENETGHCAIYGKNSEAVEKCNKKILSIIKEFTAGEKLIGTVFRIEKYGAFIKIQDTDKEAMLHISQLGNGKRIEKVEDVLKLGDIIECTIQGINDKGQIGLTFNRLFDKN